MPTQLIPEKNRKETCGWSAGTLAESTLGRVWAPPNPGWCMMPSDPREEVSGGGKRPLEPRVWGLFTRWMSHHGSLPASYCRQKSPLNLWKSRGTDACNALCHIASIWYCNQKTFILASLASWLGQGNDWKARIWSTATFQCVQATFTWTYIDIHGHQIAILDVVCWSLGSTITWSRSWCMRDKSSPVLSLLMVPLLWPFLLLKLPCFGAWRLESWHQPPDMDGDSSWLYINIYYIFSYYSNPWFSLFFSLGNPNNYWMPWALEGVSFPTQVHSFAGHSGPALGSAIFGRLVATFRSDSPRTEVTTASFSPDSTRLVTGSEDCCGRVWDVLLSCLNPAVGGEV